MAVTFKQQPQHFTPSDNPIMFVFESDNTNLPNFEFLVEVYQWGGTIGTSVKLSSHRVFPTLGNQAYFDASETISVFLNAPQLPDGTQLIVDAGNYDEFAIVVNERFGDFSNTSIFTASDAFISWKACLSDVDFENFDADDYTVKAGAAADSISFLSNVNEVRFGTQDYVMFYYDGSGSLEIELNTLDEAATPINDVQIPKTLSKGVYIINVNPIVYENEGLDLTNYVFLVTDISVNNIAVTKGQLLLKTPYFPFQDPIPFPQVLTNCYPLERRNQLFYFNKLGGIDQFIFSQRFEKRKQTERNTMEVAYGRQGIDSYTFKDSQRKRNYFNNTTFTETLQTDWLSEETHNHLVNELMESPLVFRYDDKGNQQFLQITDTTSEYRFKEFETLYQLTINLEQSKYSKSARL